MSDITTTESFYKHWGFKCAPFRRKPTAEDDRSDLLEYFAKPEWLDQTDHRQSLLLFGLRGSGKTALRFYIEHMVEKKGEGIVVPFVNFEYTDGEKNLRAGHDEHQRELVRLMLAFGLRHRLSREKVGESHSALSDDVLGMLHRHFESKTDFEGMYDRNTVGDFLLDHMIDDVLDFYGDVLEGFRENKTLRRMQKSIENRWRHLLRLLLSIFSKDEKSLDALSDLESEQKNQRGIVESDYRKLVRLAKEFGGNAWWVFVDGLDEHMKRSSEANTVTEVDKMKMAKWLASSLMLNHRQIIASKNMCWKFFVPSEIRGPISRENDTRTDKLIKWEIPWDNSSLMNELIDKRLSHFSDGNVTSLEQLCQEGHGRHIRKIVLDLANKSPRRMIQMLDEMLSVHVSYCLEKNSDPQLLTVDSASLGLGYFCEGKVEDLYDKLMVDRLKILGKTFNKDGAERVLKVADLQLELDEWLSSGAIRNVPVGENEFEITDPALIWVVDKMLILG